MYRFRLRRYLGRVVDQITLLHPELRFGGPSGFGLG